ncbi:cobalamin biosynthesis protein CobW [Granulosicoccaceae sp. 1_MG-2023]|nr:cobalamin biosynthesis protein CobW [Granulosicoccaceae sp. 1_MG-2023]
MKSMKRIPATVVTGFLGSGKTTLLRHVLANANGRRLAVIVNEFGELGIDGELLRDCGLGCEEETEVVELANGCLCCTVQEEFYPTMQRLIERRDEIDAILIETSGLALPKPLVQAFNWPEIRNACTVDAVITVVDVPATAAGQFAADPARVEAQRLADPNLDHVAGLHELFEDQLSAADLVVLSKCDCVDQAARERVEQLVRAEVPDTVKLLVSDRGCVDPEILLGVGADSQDTIDQRPGHHHHDDEDGHHHHDDPFDSIVLKVPELASETLEQALARLLEQFTIFRIKGFVAVKDKPLRRVVHGVGRRIDGYFDRPWGPAEARLGRLVFIGAGLDAQQLSAALAEQGIGA